MGKEKTVELKPRVEKISDEHLKELQKIINSINSTQFNIGKVESQKHNLLHDLARLQDSIILMRDELEKEYGSCDINVSNGSINWPKENGDEK